MIHARFQQAIALFCTRTGMSARAFGMAGQVTDSNRHVELLGLMPEVTIRHERRDSNLQLYDYN